MTTPSLESPLFFVKPEYLHKSKHILSTFPDHAQTLKAIREAEELFAEAQKMAQLRYKTYVRKTQEDWSNE